MLKDIKKKLEQAEEIATGFKNVFFTTEELEKLSEKRMAICRSCEFIRTSSKKGILQETCGKCGCFLSAKSRNPKSTCPLNKWENAGI